MAIEEQRVGAAAMGRRSFWDRNRERLKAFQLVLRSNPNMAIGLFILVLAVMLAAFAPFIATDAPKELFTEPRLQAPSREAYFGTDSVGRDVFSRTIYGSRLSLGIGASVTILTLIGGVVIGITAGYYKLADNVVMRFMDGLMAFPSFLLAIALVALLGASFQNVVLALSVVETPRVVRIVRGSVLSLRERQYVEGALAVGARPLRILAKHIFPNLVAPLTVQATYVFALAILVEAGLSFLGAGVPPDVPSWGNMMGDANLLKQLAPWMIFFPGLFLSLTVLGANLLGDGLRDTLDPRLRGTG
jgi:peptide/nickel transport system permease protein